MLNLKIFHSAVEKEFKKTGIVAKYTIVKDATIKKPRIIVNVSVFRMPDPYKDESEYINGLSILLDNFSNFLKDSVLRIYYDDSVTKKDDRWTFLIEKAKSKNFTQIVHYNFPQFKKPNSFYHEGVFGMIVRYFVLFDFGNVKETVMIDDIDYKSVEELNNMCNNINKGLKSLKSSKATYVFGTYGFRAYLTKPRLLVSDITEKYDFNIRMVTQPSICIKKLDKSILINFLLCVLNRCPEYEKWLNEFISGTNCHHIPPHNEKRKQQCNYFEEIKKLSVGVFMFGTDEFFLNGPILEDFLENKRPFIVIYEMPSMTHYHYALYLRFQKKRIPLQIMIDMYHAILEKTLHTPQDIHAAFKGVDRMIYVNNESKKGVVETPETKKIFKKIYDFLQPRADELLALPNLERFEEQMFEYLKNTKEEDFVAGKHFYEVTYHPNNHYELIRLD